MTLPWTPRPIPLPEECGDDFSILAVRPLEWSVEMVVRIGTDCHLWRVSPWRIRTTKPLRDAEKQTVREVRRAEVTPDGFRLKAFGNHVIDVRSDPVRWDVDVQSSYESTYDFDVFISYKDKDTLTEARALDEFLQAADLSVWFGPRDIFADYRRDILDGIRRSETFAVLWSEHSGDDDETLEMRGSGRRKMSQYEEITQIMDDLDGSKKNLSFFRHSGSMPPFEFTLDTYNVKDGSTGAYTIEQYAEDLVEFIRRKRATAIHRPH